MFEVMCNDPYKDYIEEFRDKINPNFMRHQEDVAKFLVEEIHNINRRGDACQIKYIIDIGCGTGEIIKYIKHNLFKDANKKEKIDLECYGYDCSEYSIKMASIDLRGVNFKTISQDVYFDLEDLDNVEWDKTLLLCLGHTLPHFVEIEKFLAKLNKYRPKFFMFDCHENWDMALNHVYQTHRTHFEPNYIDNNGNTFALATTLMSGKQNLVKRGIAKNTNAPDGSWPDYKVPTVQLNKKSEDFIKDIEAQDYHKHTMTTYKSGYGFMNCYLFVAIDENADLSNKTYAKCIKSELLPDIFDFREKSKSVLLAVQSFDCLLISVPHPFDSYFTFAEYVNPTEEWPKIKRLDHETLMVLDKTGGIQEDYPTANGLFMNLLNDPGGSLIRPFVGEKQVDKDFKDVEEDFIKRSEKYIKSLRINKDYKKIEERFIQKTEKYLKELESSKDYKDVAADFARTSEEYLRILRERDKNEGIDNSSDENRNGIEKGLFVLPIFYGALPLMFLICKPMASFSIYETHQDVFESLLINLYNSIWDMIKFLDIKNAIVRPIVEEYILNNDCTCEETAGRQIKNLFRTVYTKPWKSWVLAIPSVEINKLQVVDYQQNNINNYIEECVKDVYSDAVEIFSKAFQDCDFFKRTKDKDTHSDFYKVHLKRLKEFWLILDCELEFKMETSRILPNKIKNDENDKKLINWLTTQLNVLRLTEERSFDQEGKCQDSSSKLAYIDIKSVFCGDEENQTRKSRFSLRRLSCLLSIYQPTLKIYKNEIIMNKDEEEIIPEAGEIVNWTTSVDDKDPTNDIVNLINILSNKKSLRSVVFYAFKRDNYFRFIIEINFGWVEFLSTSGDYYVGLSTVIEDLSSSKHDIVKEFDQIKYAFCIDKRKYKLEYFSLTKEKLETQENN